MALVSVAGACSRSGKTALAATLLASLKRPAVALKFTSTDDVFERCPRGSPCVVCDIAVPYRLVQDERVLREPGTDTARLLAAGATRVVWCIARRSALELAWRAALQACAGAPVVVMEGSTIVTLAQPDLLLFVVHPWLKPERWKATSDALIERADLVIVNRPQGDTREPSADVLARLRRARGRDDLRFSDVTQPFAAWAPELLASLERASSQRPLLGAPASR